MESADAVLIGPGLADRKAIDALTARLFEREVSAASFLFDARALKSLRGINVGSFARPMVLTQHAGEMAGLLGKDRHEIEANPERWAHEAAKRFRATVALKGAETFIADPEGRSCVCRKGHVGLATSGSGDVLAGVIAGLLARGTDAFTATCWGVYLHARAGDELARTVGPLGFLAREIPAQIPDLMSRLQS
jgi:hydroxyethylthiazole kinase-like uncharacterized protein yjeF